ncbi:transcription-repair coupling factor, partial [Bacillus pacificus]|nr:transcription-repair coupling factor [Bacillus pacificus]
SNLYNEPASLIDYLTEDGVVIVDEIARNQETASHRETEEEEWYIYLLGEGTIIQDLSFSHSFEEFLHHKKRSFVYLTLFLRHIAHTHPQNIVNVKCKT